MTELPLRKRWPTLALILVLTLGGGALVGFLTRDSMAVYEGIARPGFAPPGWVFPVAWTILYAAMSVSLWLAIRKDAPSRATIVLYAVQLIVNLAWPFIFFTMQAFGLAFWWLLLLLALVLCLMVRTFRTGPVAGWLLVPYAAWTAFAAVLSFAVARLNP
ncbi:MAG: tryptophan-rich sensory protein [Clostridiales bacterium]|nr:tryptophan-rich sensory protein [Clostridiales bacterium]